MLNERLGHTDGRRVIITADDFGLSVAVNEAVERAHRDGLLNTASLMVAGSAAADAVERARRLPSLNVGLHAVVIEGPAVTTSSIAPEGMFPSDQLRLGVRYFFNREARRCLRAEIAAQYRAFAATGLRLDHANAHKHMHLHPTVGRYLIEEGLAHGLRAIRVPAEPPTVMRQCGAHVGVGGLALHRWTQGLRRQARRAGLATTDQVFGIAWSGGMTRERMLRLATALPAGVSEIYFHPATSADEAMQWAMPGYQHAAELTALLDPAVAAALPRRVSYGAL